MSMCYLFQQVVDVFVVNLTEGNPDRESDICSDVQTEAVSFRDAVHTAVRAEGGAWRHTSIHTCFSSCVECLERNETEAALTIQKC